MKFLIDLISEQLSGAFEKAGFDAAYGKATLSNRPDLCEYQCNGALAAAKKYHKAPIQIANAVLEALGENEMFASAEAVMPGYLNLKLSEDYLTAYLRSMAAETHYGAQDDPDACTIVLDYGGAVDRARVYIQISQCLRAGSGHGALACTGRPVNGDRYVFHTASSVLSNCFFAAEIPARRPVAHAICRLNPPV